MKYHDSNKFTNRSIYALNENKLYSKDGRIAEK